jgi:hypothetical protein
MRKELSGKFILPAKYPKALMGKLGFACVNTARTLRGGSTPLSRFRRETLSSAVPSGDLPQKELPHQRTGSTFCKI